MTLLPVFLLAQVVSLNGAWDFAKGSERPERFPLTVEVPAAFETAAGVDFDGVGWYRHSVDLPEEFAGRAILVRFDGAATDATVWWNGEEVGGHVGAWTPFVVDVTQAARTGRNELVVRVDEKPGHLTQGFLPVIQPHFGGLWQGVTLSAHAGPSIDRIRLHAHGDLERKRFRLSVPLREGPGAGRCQVVIELTEPAGAVVARKTESGAGGEVVRFDLEAAAVKPWSPAEPHLYRLEVKLTRGSELLDQMTTSVGFRDLEARGTGLFLNGRPLQVRGMLHWGHEPPLLAPHAPEAVWRREIADLKALGFNLIKCCLWVPPRRFYELADELGMLVWQEYPTWHARIARDTRDDLLREFDEFFHHDRGHPSVILRSLTCETGHGADSDVMRALYELCHERVPDTLVNDDSSWISWSRHHDFYDDHPYLNHDAWVPALHRFRQHIATHGAKPLVLGEAITADTWVDRAALLAAVGEERPWWLPKCFAAQGPFEERVIADFGGTTLQRFLPDSLAYGMASRKHQIETLRRELPDAGYVVSVLRDFPLARMGLYDPLGKQKWGIGEWAWHRDAMFVLRTERDRRAFRGGSPVKAEVLLALAPGAHAGRKPSVKVELRGLESDFAQTARLDLGAGHLHPVKSVEASTPSFRVPRRFELAADATEDLGVWNRWGMWVVPPAEPAREGFRLVRKLDRETLEFLEGGGRAIHLASLDRGSLRCKPLAYYRGAPWAPDHPIHGQAPLPMLMELQPLDLAGPGAMPMDRLWGQVDPILAFWDTHDLDRVVPWLFAFETRVGKGRLLVSSLAHDEGNAAGRYLLAVFAEHLLRGPAPARALSGQTLAELRQAVAAEVIQLDDGWKLIADPEDGGRSEKWFEPGYDDARGLTVRAGSHWEKQGLAHYDGVAWYRKSFELPESWKGRKVTAVFEGVDDSYDLWLNGKWLASRGDPETGETVWLVRTTVELTDAVAPGRNQMTLRVVDHAGAGGLHRPVYVTTGSGDAVSDLLN